MSESQFGPSEHDVGEPMPASRAFWVAVGPTLMVIVLILIYAIAASWDAWFNN